MSTGLAVLVDTSHWSLAHPLDVGFSVSTFQTTGRTASAFSSNPGVNSSSGSITQSITHGESMIVGGFGGAGLSFGVTNANVPSDLAGPAATYSASAGLGLDVSGQISRSDGGVVVGTVSPPVTSVGIGISASAYRTDTKVQTLFSTEPSK